MSVKWAELKFMSALAEASFLVRKLSEPCPPGDKVKVAIERAYSRIVTRAARDESLSRLRKWTLNRTRELWKADHRVVVGADELLQLRALARQEQEDVDRDEFQELRQRIAILEHRLVSVDAEFHCATIEALGQSAQRKGERVS